MLSSSAFPSMDVGDVGEDVKCPICMEYLTDPVTLDCGHNFCRVCISQHCDTQKDLDEDPQGLECPLCKAKINTGNFRPNWQLARIAEKIKRLSLNLEKEHLCVRHLGKLDLFCKEDKEFLCLYCMQSPEHQLHRVLLLEEAAKEYKDQMCCCLEVLRTKRICILESARTEKESQDLLDQIGEKKTRMVTVFNELHQFLEEQETFLLSQLEELEKEIATRRKEHMDRLLEELSSIEDLTQQMEEKCQLPAYELLQDIRRTLESFEKKEAVEYPVALPSKLTCRLRGFRDVKPVLEGIIEQFPANVTLDPDTAHPQLILSEDLKSVRMGDKWQALPDNPERFDKWNIVLACEGFTTGKHFWDVDVGNDGEWSLGVASKSVWRKGWFDICPEEGIWALELLGDTYQLFNHPDNPDYPIVTLGTGIKRIRVTLNCAEQQLSFTDADSGVHIYTYSGGFFSGETLLPFFSLKNKAHLTLCQ